MPDAIPTRKLAAIFVADVVGYSKLIRADEISTLSRLKSIRSEIVDTNVSDRGGRIVKTMGDGILVEFTSAVEAVGAAIDIQNAVTELNQEIQRRDRIEWRIGINIGDVVVEHGDLFGDGVNLASRLETLADPGGICVSPNVYEQVRNRTGYVFSYGGEQKVKQHDPPIQAWCWERESETIDQRIDDEIALPDKPSIAVLPFENMSRDPEQEFFADGISADLTTALSKLRWFFVVARNSSFVFKGHSYNSEQIAKELGVRYIVEGSVRQAGKRIRVNVQLIDALNGTHLWADRFDRELVDVFDMQDEMVQKISSVIEPELLAAEATEPSISSGQHLGAWGLLVRARTHFWRMTSTETAKAIAYLEAAIKSSPSYGPAYSALSFSLLFSVQMGWRPLANVRQEALRYALKAAELDDLDPWVHVSLGYLAIFSRETDHAIAEFTRAIDLNPNFAAGIGWRGLAHAFGGRSKAAIADLDLAMKLSPFDPQNVAFVSAIGVSHYLAGQYEDALVYTTKSLELRPDFIGGHRIHCAVLSQLDRPDDAAVAFQRVCQLQPNISASILRETVPYARSEDMDHFLLGLQKAGLPG